MSNSDLPKGTADDAALSLDDGADAIENLFGDPEADLSEDDQAVNEADEESDAEGDEPEAEDDDEADAEEGDDQQEEQDGPSEYASGRFAADNAKVTLDDGTVITVADLKRNNLFQRDYTRKTQELAEDRKNFQQVQQQVDQYALAIAQQRDFLAQAAQQFMPLPPDKAMREYDPLGYQAAKEDYDERVRVLSQIQAQQHHQQQWVEHERQRQDAELRQQEAARLFEAMPELRDQKVYRKFWDEAVETVADYGFSAEELDQMLDHRFYKAVRDLAKYRKAKASQPKVKQDLQNRPKLIKGGKRMDPKAKTSREAQAKSERLRRTGRFEDGVAALMDFDL